MTLSRQSNQRLREFISQSGLLFAAATLGYAVYRSQGLIQQALQHWWDRVGWVMLGLLPLSVYLLFIIAKLIVSGNARNAGIKNGLDLVLFSAPLLGMLGTVLGLIEALMQFYQIQGTENLMEVLSEFLRGASLMLYTTAWGLLLALPAGLLKKWLFPEASVDELISQIQGIREETTKVPLIESRG